ncbi:MAG: trypsin-like peptidase domain-containing protein [Candidatus Bathyarchaeota archaeon]|nr:trypsin-like peptidase domain-containing protein [Candidatus Bathyarchaeota archaeon]
MLTSQRCIKATAGVLALLFVAGLLVGGLGIYFVMYRQVQGLNAQIGNMQARISSLEGFQNATYQNITIFQNETSLVDIYANVRQSVVLIQGETSSGGVQGSGFVYNFGGRNVVLTNYHVVESASGLSVTFYNGNGYSAAVLGTDPYSDLAVLSVNAPASEFKPIEIVSSSTLNVGEPVIAIGNPYGLVGSLTTGVVSALGRSITEDTAGGFAIANIIQTSAPINPGNSGGPLLNSVGKVVGITTAIVSQSQGLGFAIPSNTILREISALISTGTYQGHSYLGVSGQDMSYKLAQQTGVNVTYGWRIESVVSRGPSDGKLAVGDIIIALNGVTIKNNDDLAAYLEEHTLPGDSLVMTVIRNHSSMDVTVVLGTRPPP